MKDRFFRKIDYLRISLNSSCNLACRYCGRIKEKSSTLPPEDILLVVKACLELGINRFRLTGGEPLLSKDCPELIKAIRELPGLKDLSLTTNAVLLSNLAPKLKAAGLERINISLDTLSREKFKQLTGQDWLNKVLRGIKAARQAGFAPLRINVVLMRKINREEVFGFLEFAAKNNLQLRFIELMPRSLKDKFFKENFVPAGELKAQIAEKFKLVSLSRNGPGPARYYRLAEQNLAIGIIAPVSERFCNACNRLRLSSWGTLQLCLFNKKEVKLKAALSGKDLKLLKQLIKKAVYLKPPGKEEEDWLCRQMIKTGG